MHFHATALFGLLTTAAALPSPAQATHDMVPETFTKPDGTTATIYLHQSIKRTSGKLSPRARFPKLWFFKHKDSHQNLCGHSSFEDATIDTSAHVEGCQTIIDWHRENKGLYSVDWMQGASGGRYVELMMSKENDGANCVFEVSHDAWAARIGNTDIADIVQDSMNRFARDLNGRKRVAATGTMGCDADLVKDGNAAVHWRVKGMNNRVN